MSLLHRANLTCTASLTLVLVLAASQQDVCQNRIGVRRTVRLFQHVAVGSVVSQREAVEAAAALAALKLLLLFRFIQKQEPFNYFLFVFLFWTMLRPR